MKTNKLCGVEFEAPISLDEVPMTPDEKGSRRAYYMIRLNPGPGWSVEDFSDNGRKATRKHVATGMCHWTTSGAWQHIEAMHALAAYLEKHAA